MQERGSKMNRFEKNWKYILELINSGKTDEEIEELTEGHTLAGIRKIRRNIQYYQKRVEEAEKTEKPTFEEEWTKAVNRMRAYYGKPPLGGEA